MAAAAVTGVGVVAALRMAVLVPVWKEHDRTIGEFWAAIASLSPGSRILPALAGPIKNGLFRAAFSGWTHYAHLAEIAVSDIGAFSPFLFSVPGRQPIRVRPKWRIGRKSMARSCRSAISRT